MQTTQPIEEMALLIIDDSQANTMLLEAILKNEGLRQIYVSHSLECAMQKLQDHTIDLILLSFVLPNISGLEVAKNISQDLRYEDIPIIMVTANNNRQTLKKSFEHGASDYISKPINSIELSARVYSHLIRKQVNDERKHRAVTDGLTGLFNRRYFDTVYSREYEKARTENKPLAFIIIDIDHFKPYNDHYGHQQGDHALVNVAHILKSSLKRESDYLFRLGGEEFAVLLFDTYEGYTQTLCEHIHENLKHEALAHAYNANLGIVTVSIGVAFAKTVTSYSKFDIYNLADEALYEAKQHGRNQTRLKLL